MEKFIVDAANDIGGQWLSICLALAWLIYKSGVVQKFFSIAANEPMLERERLSEDQQNLFRNMEATVVRLERRIDADRAEHKRQLEWAAQERSERLAELRAECEGEMRKMEATISTLAAGEGRWRHLTGNLAQYVAALQAALRKHSIEVPRFTGWDRFIAEGGDPVAMLSESADGC